MDNSIFDILQDPERCCLHEIMQNVGTIHDALDDAREAITLQNHFDYQFCSFT
jgi:hypothetical protein